MTPKTLLCIRHGESTFNAAWRADPVDPRHFDARLSEAGRAQVRLAREVVRRYPVQRVITSPLTRALQTATGLFGDHPAAPAIEVCALLRERVENPRGSTPKCSSGTCSESTEPTCSRNCARRSRRKPMAHPASHLV